MKRIDITTKRRDQKSKKKSSNLPEYCDFNCEHAAFAEVDAIGACRRDQGIFCTLFKRYNNKHSKCLNKKIK